MAKPMLPSKIAKIMPEKRPCLITLRAPLLSPAPTRCATCTEKPAANAPESPPKSQMVVETRPTAEALVVLRCPSIAASIICMAMIEKCAIIAGMAKSTVRRSFCRSVISLPASLTRAKSSSLVYAIYCSSGLGVQGVQGVTLLKSLK